MPWVISLSGLCVLDFVIFSAPSKFHWLFLAQRVFIRYVQTKLFLRISVAAVNLLVRLTGFLTLELAPDNSINVGKKVCGIYDWK